MILEFSLDYRSSSLVYEKIFLKLLKEHGLSGKIIKNKFSLKFYVVSEDMELLKDFITNFSSTLPHSIFLYANDAQMLEEMPEGNYELNEDKKTSLPFCLECLHDVMDETGDDYYNIFKECSVCGYSVDGEKRSYKKEFEKIAQDIKNGKNVELSTLYGKYIVGLPSKLCNEYKCDLIAYDYATINEYMNAIEEELTAIASFEKPFVKLSRKMKLALDYEDVEVELFRCKLPDDLVLHLLMQELYALDERLMFISKEKIDYDEQLHLNVIKEEQEPIELVVSSTHRAIVKGEKGLQEFEVLREEVVPSHGALLSVVNEHSIDAQNIAGLYLSKERQSSLVVYGKKYDFIDYLYFTFSFSSVKEVMNAIVESDETARKLVENYTNKFPQHLEKIKDISWKKEKLSIYDLWGVAAIILNLTQSDDIYQAAQDLEDNNMKFLGEKGPRIDYKLIKEEKQIVLDPLKMIRSAISFKLAGIDNLTLSYGIMESFVEFIAHEIDVLKESMSVEAVVISGSMLENKKLFRRLCKDINDNHKLYFHNELLVDGDSIFK